MVVALIGSVCVSSVAAPVTRAAAKQGTATTFPTPSTPKRGIFFVFLFAGVGVGVTS